MFDHLVGVKRANTGIRPYSWIRDGVIECFVGEGGEGFCRKTDFRFRGNDKKDRNDKGGLQLKEKGVGMIGV